MAIRIVNLGKEDLPKILIKGLSKPINNAKPFFDALAAKMYQQIGVTFKRQGARAGNSAWERFSERTLHPSSRKTGIGSAVFINTKKWNKRPGTDDSKTRRYNTSSKLLQASGGFRNSFTIIKTDKRRSIVGTKMKIAKAIMSNPDRPVLFVNKTDWTLYTSMFRKFVNEGIKF